MRFACVVAVLAGCSHPAPASPAPAPAIVLDPAPPAGVIAPRGVKVLHVEAHPAPAKQRWSATFEPDRASLAATIAQYRADLEGRHIEVTTFAWEPRALDYSIGTGGDRLDVFVRPGDDDRTFSIDVAAPGL
jgi:hypothetical protein